jgi:hypothetical protein
MAKYWAIDCNNFRGENDTFYFENYKIAKENFEILCEKNKNQEEFKRYDEYSGAWFDPNYNEYLTFIDLTELEMPVIHNEIIF